MKLLPLFAFLFFTQILLAQTFIESTRMASFEGLSFSAVAFADVDGDNDQDLLLTGLESAGDTSSTVIDFSVDAITKLYINDGLGNFIEKEDTSFEDVSSSSISFTDVDGDNDLDVFIMGRGEVNVFNEPPGSSKLYINDGLGNFTKKLNTPFEDIWVEDIAVADVDGDGDQDILLMGRLNEYTSPVIRITRLYTNDGFGNYTEKTASSFQEISIGAVRFADVDGDNDQDVLILGKDHLDERIAKLYFNDGLGDFSEKSGTLFPGIAGHDFAFTDVDGDNDQDVLIIGQDEGNTATKLYMNDGQGNFTKKIDAPFVGVVLGSIAFADFDNDADQDVLINGYNYTLEPSEGTRLYKNDGQGNFRELPNTSFENVANGAIAVADVNGDNTQDILITGQNSEARITELYLNDGMTTDITEVEEQEGINSKLYPNPSANGVVYLDYTSDKQERLIISLFKVDGSLVFKQETQVFVGMNTILLDYAQLFSGLYFVILDDGEHINSQKLMMK